MEPKVNCVHRLPNQQATCAPNATKAEIKTNATKAVIKIIALSRINKSLQSKVRSAVKMAAASSLELFRDIFGYKYLAIYFLFTSVFNN